MNQPHGGHGASKAQFGHLPGIADFTAGKYWAPEASDTLVRLSTEHGPGSSGAQPWHPRPSVYKQVEDTGPSDQWISQLHYEKYFAFEEDHRPFDATSTHDLLLKASSLTPVVQSEIPSSTNDSNEERSSLSNAWGGQFHQISHIRPSEIRPQANSENPAPQTKHSAFFLNDTGELSDEWRMWMKISLLDDSSPE